MTIGVKFELKYINIIKEKALGIIVHHYVIKFGRSVVYSVYSSFFYQ